MIDMGCPAGLYGLTWAHTKGEMGLYKLYVQGKDAGKSNWQLNTAGWEMPMSTENSGKFGFP